MNASPTLQNLLTAKELTKAYLAGINKYTHCADLTDSDLETIGLSVFGHRVINHSQAKEVALQMLNRRLLLLEN